MDVIIDFLKINDTVPVPDGDGDFCVKAIDDRIDLGRKIIDEYPALIRVDDPVFPDTGSQILVQLDRDILPARGRRENLDDEIRRSIDATADDFAAVADDYDIRLYHRLLITVELDIDRGDHREAGALVGADMCEKPCINESGDQLVIAAWCGHIIDHAVDQLDPPLVRDLIIVGQGIRSLALCLPGCAGLPDLSCVCQFFF